MNQFNKYYGIRKKFTTDKNYVDPIKQMEMERKQKEEEEKQKEMEEIEEEDIIISEYNLLIEELEDIKSVRKLKEFIRENKDKINNLIFEEKEQLLKHIKRKYYG